MSSINQENREKWLKETIAKIPSGSRILDAGAGECLYKKFCNHLVYISQDFGKYQGQGDGRGFQTGKWDQSNVDIISDIVNIPEPDSSYDAIMCIEVFEHLPEPLSAIKEFERLLKPGGFLILTAPFCSLTHMAPYHFYSGFNRYFYEKALKDNNFQIMEITENGNFFDFLIQEINRIPEIIERYVPDKKMNFFNKYSMDRFVSILKDFSNEDRGSSELLTFGFHIFARKN